MVGHLGSPIHIFCTVAWIYYLNLSTLRHTVECKIIYLWHIIITKHGFLFVGISTTCKNLVAEVSYEAMLALSFYHQNVLHLFILIFVIWLMSQNGPYSIFQNQGTPSCLGAASSCLVWPRLALPCHALSCLVLSCLGLNVTLFRQI